MDNTKKYAKKMVVKKVEMNKDKVEDMKVKQIYVYEPKKVSLEDDPNAWRAVLVDSFCQAGKTKKCFEILSSKISVSQAENTLVLFVTQANSVASANQVVQRAMVSDVLRKMIPTENIFRCGDVPLDVAIGGGAGDSEENDDGLEVGNYMIVDFWNSRNMTVMLDFIRLNRGVFDEVIIVVDECEQGNLKGLKERLSFVRNVEKAASDESIVKVIFVTATVANLSKGILQIAKQNMVKFQHGVVSEIINKPVVEHQFAQPHETYVGASWFKKNEGVWKKLVFPAKSGEMSNGDYVKVKEAKIMQEVRCLPDEAKELSLVVTSTLTSQHTSLCERMYRSGYNVTVELNGVNNKNFKVKYVNNSGDISSWDIPYSYVDAKAEKGDLKTYRNCARKLKKTGISGKEDYTMSHVLQAALFMMTEAEDRIKVNVADDEYVKLDVLINCINNLDVSLRRPDDYPEMPRVAMVAGHLAGRGITIQHPGIDFTCTSFVFSNTKDGVSRGATNTQRFGRACGMLMNAFARVNRKPVLIATEGILQDALANERALREKAEMIENGTLISLKDLVTQEEWLKVMKETKKELQAGGNGEKKKHSSGEIVDGVNVEALKHYFKSKNLIIGKMIRFLYEQNKKVSFDEFKSGIGYTKSDKQFMSNIKNGLCANSCYGKLWICVSGTCELNEYIRNALDRM